MNQLLIITPLLYSLFFIHIRNKYTTKKYLISAIPFVIEIIIFICFTEYGYEFTELRFSIYSVFFGLVAIIIICSIKLKNIVLTFFQFGLSFFVFHFCTMLTGSFV